MLFDALPRPATEVASGVAHLPGWLGARQQHRLVTQARQIARQYASTPMAMVRPQLKSGRMSVFMLHLGHFWDYETYRYVDVKHGVRVPALPRDMADLAGQALKAAAGVSSALEPWAQDFRPDMALVNYYPPGATMGMHQDAYERTDAPIISLSIGDEALFRIGSTDNRNRPWDEVTLCSGDLIVFGGPKRQAFHGVPDVRPETLPAGCGLKEGRINITFRQVFSA